MSGLKPSPFYWLTITRVKNWSRAQPCSVPVSARLSKMAPLFLLVLVMAFDYCAFLLHPHLFLLSESSNQASFTWWLVVKRMKLQILYRPGSHAASQLPYSTGQRKSEGQPKSQGKRRRHYLLRRIMCAQEQGELLTSLFVNSLETYTQKKPISGRVSPWLLRQTHNR